MPKNAPDPETSALDDAAWRALRDWERELDTGTRKRGSDYARLGKVKKTFIASDGITGIVKGSDPRPYRTHLRYSERGKSWSADCDCPVGVSCKHAVAVALTTLAAIPAGSALKGEFSWSEKFIAEVLSGYTRKISKHDRMTLELMADSAEALSKGKFTDGNLSRLFRDLMGYSYGTLDAERRFIESMKENGAAGIAAFLAALAIQCDTLGITPREWMREAWERPEISSEIDRLENAGELAHWRGILAGMDATPPPATAGKTLRELRLKRVSEWSFVWQTRSDASGEWRPMSLPEKKEICASKFVPEGTFSRECTGAVRAFRSVYGLHESSTIYTILTSAHDTTMLAKAIDDPLLSARIVNLDDSPMAPPYERLVWIFVPATTPGTLAPKLAFTGGAPAPSPLHLIAPRLYLAAGGFLSGPAPLDGYAGTGRAPEIPEGVFEDSRVRAAVRSSGARIVADDEMKKIPLHPRVRVRHGVTADGEFASARLDALDADGRERLRHDNGGWNPGAHPCASDELPVLGDAAAALAHFRTGPVPGGRPGEIDLRSTKAVATLADWLSRFPAGTVFEVDPELASLVRPPDKATFVAEIEESGNDWFDLKLVLKPEDAELTKAELKLLLAHRGEWVRVPGKGWRKLAAELSPETGDKLAGLGLSPESSDGEPMRFHAAQLAGDRLAGLIDESNLRKIRARAERLAALPPPALPSGLRAALRPYQRDGYHFLAHLAANGLGGILADDMGLGKTLQTIAWLLWLKETRPTRPRFLVVAPKSVVPNWAAEVAKFAPGMTVSIFGEDSAKACDKADLVVANYTRLRLATDAFLATGWTAVILDEGQHIKNPTSQIAETARALKTGHRVILSGTPVENRLLDLWSLYAFAMPGLLGTQAGFRRQYDEKKDGAAAARLATRLRPFLLRRTKAQVATDLPARIEEDFVVELEPAQRKLYDAELKKARALLLGAKRARDFDKSRFNILSSLLRLRQICCDPRLVSPKAKSSDSAKLDALWGLLEPLLAEGHKVLVFSQFTEALELVGEKLAAEKIDFLTITGATENRAELVTRFQKPDTEKIFLLSLKAAGTGLNLTAASYVVLFDPWWNPAAEAQAIDRTHRIGQKNRVIAYRLIAKNTVEQKIRALQRDKAALAGEILQEESLSKVLDLDTLRGILAE